MSLLSSVFRELFKTGKTPPGETSKAQFGKAVNDKFNAAVQLQLKGKEEAARKYYAEILEQHPDYVWAYNNIGYMHETRGEYNEAIGWYSKGLSFDASNTDCLSNLAYSQKMIGDYRGSLRSYDTLIKATGDPVWYWKKSLVLLLTGKYRSGWDAYEKRSMLGQGVIRSYGLKRWDGSSLENKTILVTPEQGIGDEIYFSACFPRLSQTAGRCIVHCDKRLEKLFARSFPAITTFSGKRDANAQWLDEYKPVDYEIPIGSLPEHIYPDLDRSEDDDRYLHADSDRLAFWQQRLASINELPKIGISWRGGKTAAEILQRSILADDWGEVFDGREVQFVNLQYGNCSGDLDAFRSKYRHDVLAWDDLDIFNDIDEFAALIKALDLVITIDNSTAHLAGALGQATWTVLPFSPDWRWGLGGSCSKWYPSTRLYRQARTGDWSDVVHRIADDLDRMI